MAFMRLVGAACLLASSVFGSQIETTFMNFIATPLSGTLTTGGQTTNFSNEFVLFKYSFNTNNFYVDPGIEHNFVNYKIDALSLTLASLPGIPALADGYTGIMDPNGLILQNKGGKTTIGYGTLNEGLKGILFWDSSIWINARFVFGNGDVAVLSGAPMYGTSTTLPDPPTATPEPASMALVGVGIASAGFLVRRQKRA